MAPDPSDIRTRYPRAERIPVHTPREGQLRTVDQSWLAIFGDLSQVTRCGKKRTRRPPTRRLTSLPSWLTGCQLQECQKAPHRGYAQATEGTGTGAAPPPLLGVPSAEAAWTPSLLSGELRVGRLSVLCVGTNVPDFNQRPACAGSVHLKKAYLPSSGPSVGLE